MSAALKKITTRAKQIRRMHPNKSWAACIKAAGADYRAGKIAGTSSRSLKTSLKKKKLRLPHGYKVIKRKRVGAIPLTPASAAILSGIGTVSSHKKAAANIVKHKLGLLLVRISQEPKISVRKKLNKKAAALKKELKALC